MHRWQFKPDVPKHEACAGSRDEKHFRPAIHHCRLAKYLKLSDLIAQGAIKSWFQGCQLPLQAAAQRSSSTDI